MNTETAAERIDRLEKWTTQYRELVRRDSAYRETIHRSGHDRPELAIADVEWLVRVAKAARLDSRAAREQMDDPGEPIDVPDRDKQVVHVRAARFTALVDSGVDTREFDRALTTLGIELVIDGAAGVVVAEPAEGAGS